MNPRVQAARVVSTVCDGGRSLDAVLPPALEALGEARDRPLVQDLAYGTLRWRLRLAVLAAGLLRRPFKPRDAELTALLHVALYELLYTARPAHAVVDQTVAAVRELDRAWAVAVVNAVLRRFLRERSARLARLDADEEARWAHPAWLLARWRADWPADWERIADHSNARPPMWLRVNLSRLSRNAYRTRLERAGLGSEAAGAAPGALKLERPVPLEALPGFAAGEVSVQDVSAQRIAGLLDPRPGQRVLDACAAPGGKSSQLLETVRGLELLAVDRDAGRLQRVRDTFARLGLAAACRVGDAGRPADWWDGQPFDRILVDAPCTATGVIRRHPDIKCLRRPEDIETMAARQAAMLAAVWPLLAPGGMLLYATCSVLARENDGVIDAFAMGRSDCSVRSLDVGWGRPCRHGRQVLPGDGDGDGFYYALMDRLA